MSGVLDLDTDSMYCPLSGQCNTVEGNCRGKYEYNGASVPGSPIPGSEIFLICFLTGSCWYLL